MSSLNDLIVSAISGVSEEDIESEVEKTASVSEPTDFTDSSIEKVAAALEFVGNNGIETFINIEKIAAMQGLSPEITHSAVSGENAGAAQSYGKSEEATHHSGLSSNESAMNYGPEARNKMVNPTLKSLLSNANDGNIRKAKILKEGGKTAAETKELIRQAIAAKMAE